MEDQTQLTQRHKNQETQHLASVLSQAKDNKAILKDMKCIELKEKKKDKNHPHEVS